MKNPVSISDLDLLFETSDGMSINYVDKESGKTIMIMDETMRAAEKGEPYDDQPEWMQESYAEAMRVLDNPDNFIDVPNQYYLDTYRYMERYALGLEDQALSDKLYNVLKRSKPFRHFKDFLYEHGIQDEWFAYWDNVRTGIIKEWCEANELEYTD